ncbi:methyltransferase, FxLD system [Umezawaea sp. Da 62-37]|uniref:methyltransferase, FxLD system n=1 Tax=Umezawaea sp. Da 62-37 TaxID=3075927 RepID=UPI0028F748C4|nr:methyltransferase, FxLD system [Umezawaea sp. Da 62-37]WNV83035.1 methyltransferase, FxLD system [Umezawaea sp. Da 62-37]
MTPPTPAAAPPPHDPTAGWGQSLSSGATGTALLHIGHARAGLIGWSAAHQWIAAMTRSPLAAHPDACLFNGAPAVAFVLRATGLPAYARALHTLDEHIAHLTRRRLDTAHQRLDDGRPARLREFDLINGLTGIGAYLLHTGHDALLRDVLSYLVRLVCEPIALDGEQLPGWWTGNEPADRPCPQWPGGHANLSIAHGITGPLALLATATISGITVPGDAEAIEQICAVLDRWQRGTRTTPWWPGTINSHDWRTGTTGQTGPQRPSWCYGTPGITRAQQLAGLALGNQRRRRAAENALVSCVTDHQQLSLLDGASLCHGWAGLVQTVHRAADDAGPGSELATLLPRLHTDFRQHLRDHRPPDGDGLLEGATGVALALHSAAEPAFHWDACLLLTAPKRTTEHERNGMTTTHTQPEDLRGRMVDHIVEHSQGLSAEVEQVLRTVARHPFVPDASVEDAYANRAITIKPGPPGGRPASCISVPTVVAMMLTQLDVQPGQRVLEIGAGTGWNAALLAELVGETGHVSTIDIHPDVTEHARRALAATGYDRVHVITGDGALGDPENGPFDRIIVTVGPWDLPPAWFDQLAPGGRLVVPLSWRGQTRSVAFVNDNGVLRATDSRLCGFIPMIGDGQNSEQKGEIADDVLLYWDPDQPVNVDALHGVLDTPASTVWSGTMIVAMESTDLIWPLMTAVEPGTVRFCAGNDAVEAGLAHPAFRYSSVALVDGESLAYMALKNPDPDAQTKHWELGAIGHGPAGEHLAERLCAGIRAWGQDRTAQPVITAYRAGTPDNALTNGQVIDKQFIRLVVSH